MDNNTKLNFEFPKSVNESKFLDPDIAKEISGAEVFVGTGSLIQLNRNLCIINNTLNQILEELRKK